MIPYVPAACSVWNSDSELYLCKDTNDRDLNLLCPVHDLVADYTAMRFPIASPVSSFATEHLPWPESFWSILEEYV